MGKKITTEDFIEKAKLVHGEKYDYSKVNYVNNSTNVIIICPEHGEFLQHPNNHIHGQGCPKCGRINGGKNRKIGTENFIKKAKEIHGDKYDYSKVEYDTYNSEVCIICPEHGEFWQNPGVHIGGSGCPKCSLKNRTQTIDSFIKKAKEIHGDKYDYSKVEYINSKTKVCIICPEHGEFWQTPSNHLRGQECPKCACKNNAQNRTIGTEEFITRARKIHDGKYDYSKTEYKTCFDKVCIICPEHGEFWQECHNHLKGQGCPKCAKEQIASNQFLSKDTILKRFNEIHGNKYDYSKFEYNGICEKSCIICPEHGEFWQTPHIHLKGSGCPKCKSSTLENEIRLFLDRNKINYIYQYFPKFLNNGGGHQSLDFFLPEYNIAIECQGMQHFKPVKLFGGDKQLIKQIRLDKKKKLLCESNNINVLYFSRYKYKPNGVISSLKELLYEIRKFPKI